MDYYSVVKKKNETMRFAIKWIELENILDEVNQTQKLEVCRLSHGSF